MGNRFHRALAAATVLSLGVGAATAADNCYPAKGKIFNNAQVDGSTLGVVALVLGSEKTKCAIVGVPQMAAEQTFHHTIVCESAAAPDQAQDQLTLHSTVKSTVVTGTCPGDTPPTPVSFSFTEDSSVIAGSGRGSFADVVSGDISISGKMNCNGGISMQFEGKICFPN